MITRLLGWLMVGLRSLGPDRDRELREWSAQQDFQRTLEALEPLP